MRKITLMLICLIILVSSCQTIKKTSDVDKEEYNISKDIEEIKSKFFKNKPGLYFSLSKIDFDKNFTNKSIMIKNPKQKHLEKSRSQVRGPWFAPNRGPDTSKLNIKK